MGGAVADYNNDGWPDLYLTGLGGNVLFPRSSILLAKFALVPGRFYSASAVF
jgi:hypothetical protein